jgi:hypothetical protein
MSVFFVRIATAAAVLGLGACTWVPIEAGGRGVQVAPATQDLTVCGRSVGTVTVSVRDSVAFIERNALKVRDELETLARNEAATLSADVIQPLEEPRNGEQRFRAFRCDGNVGTPRAASVPSAAPAPTQEPAGAETFPVDGRPPE